MSENVACSKLFIFMLCNVQAKDNYCKPFFSQLNKFELGDYYLLKFHSYVYTWLKIWHKMIFLQKGGLVTCKVLYSYVMFGFFFVKIGPCWNILCIQIMLHSENQKLVFQKKSIVCITADWELLCTMAIFSVCVIKRKGVTVWFGVNLVLS